MPQQEKTNRFQWKKKKKTGGQEKLRSLHYAGMIK